MNLLFEGIEIPEHSVGKHWTKITVREYALLALKYATQSNSYQRKQETLFGRVDGKYQNSITDVFCCNVFSSQNKNLSLVGYKRQGACALFISGSISQCLPLYEKLGKMSLNELIDEEKTIKLFENEGVKLGIEALKPKSP